MAKEVVRLTESNLRSIIQETVMTLLEDRFGRYQDAYDASANASQDRINAYNQKHGKNAWQRRTDRFRNASSKAFNDEYGYNVKADWEGNFNAKDASKPFYGGQHVYGHNGDDFVSGRGKATPDGQEVDTVHNYQSVDTNTGTIDNTIPRDDTKKRPSLHVPSKVAQMKGDARIRKQFQKNESVKKRTPAINENKLNKKPIHLTIGDMRNLVIESLNRVLNEGYGNSSYDINEIGSIEYSSSFDEEEYQEWLSDEGLTANEETLKRFFTELVEFELELTDSDSYHHLDWQHMSYDEIIDEYGQNIADEILSDCMSHGKGSLEVLNFVCDDIDINDPQQLNAEAMKLLKHGNYFKDARGYILTNGVVVYTPAEHNMVSIINGIKETFHFISLGNIRVLPNSIDIAKMPTPEQQRTLMKVVQSYAGDILYVDYKTPNGYIPKQYNHPSFELVMSDIERLFG